MLATPVVVKITIAYICPVPLKNIDFCAFFLAPFWTRVQVSWLPHLFPLDLFRNSTGQAQQSNLQSMDFVIQVLQSLNLGEQFDRDCRNFFENSNAYRAETFFGSLISMDYFIEVRPIKFGISGSTPAKDVENTIFTLQVKVWSQSNAHT